MKHLKIIAIIFALLIISLPVCFAVEITPTYDGNGNMQYDGDTFTEYNSMNQPVRVYNGSNSSGTLLQAYTYDSEEERMLIKHDYVKNETVYYFDIDYYRVKNSTGTYDYELVYLEGQLIAQVNPDGSKLYMHDDAKGSVAIITNQTGSIIESTSYDLSGNILTNGSKSRFNYENKEYDPIVKDTNFNFRKYDSKRQILKKPDDVIPNSYNPQFLNRYMFELGNPVNKRDDNGHMPRTIFDEIKDAWQWGNLNYFSDAINNIQTAWQNDDSVESTVVKETYSRTPYLSDTVDVVNWATTEGMVSTGAYYNTPEMKSRLSQSRKDASFATISILVDRVGPTSSKDFNRIRDISEGYGYAFGRNVFKDLFESGTNLINSVIGGGSSSSTSSHTSSSGSSGSSSNRNSGGGSSNTGSGGSSTPLSSPILDSLFQQTTSNNNGGCSYVRLSCK